MRILSPVWCLAVLVISVNSSWDETVRADSSLRVMSFNIRYGTARDGENHWDKRQELVAEAIKRFNPDLLGTQETLAFQAAYLRKELPEYVYYGAGREKQGKGEQCGIFYRKDRFELVEQKTFWLSTTPDQEGSKSWDSSLPRIASWVRLKDKKSEGRELVFLNTHFDHRGSEARHESAKLIRQRIAKFGPDTPVIITGDFNTPEGSPPYEALVGKQEQDSIHIRDTYRVARPLRGDQEGTFGAWRGRREGARIDWVLHNSHFETVRAAIDTWNRDGRYPSDHFAVNATLNWGR